MIPLHLSISGFLSYRDLVDIDLSKVELACISGPNGAGKSSLLDAVTWALFGQARKRDDSVINAQSQMAWVSMIFGYENNVYRVERSKQRDKPVKLEFQILQAGSWQVNGDAGQGVWKTITEHTLRETEASIERTLRLDYDTFVNASFFLQNKADQFTKQRPGDRKRILSSVLGLEVWEEYRKTASERRRQEEGDLAHKDGQLMEILEELGEEDARRARLLQIEIELGNLSQVCTAQEQALDAMKKVAATLEGQRRMVENLERQLSAARSRLDELEQKISQRQEERESFARLLSRAQEIEASYEAWLEARQELERWEVVAGQFRQHEKRRQVPLDEIRASQVRLEEQLGILKSRQREAHQLEEGQDDLEKAHAKAMEDLRAAELELQKRADLEHTLSEARQHQAEARAENPRLKREMDELKERIDRLGEAEGASCPLCGQPMSQAERDVLIRSLEAQGTELGNRYRANLNLMKETDRSVSELEAGIRMLSQVEASLRSHQRAADQIANRLQASQQALQEWEQQGLPRLEEIEAMLAQDSFAHEARRKLAEVDAELKSIGYDASAHDEARRRESAGRSSENGQRDLDRARAASGPLERELADLCSQQEAQYEEVRRQQDEYDQAARAWEEAVDQAPDVDAAERELLRLEERQNLLHMEVGAARQKVEVLADLKNRRKILEAQRDKIARRVGQFKQLEKAFGKDGVPALLIEQALPEIEAKSNELLDRLSGGNMSVRFVTQTAYKNKQRDDLKETLDIQISDGAGTRDYEMYSGGEAFRVDFAIRLALSEVLAQRAGARLQTLVIDEGFGSQDQEGRQRLIEAINSVQSEFAKVLVITHIDELKDAFPARIEVEKTSRGSTVRVV